MPARKRSASSSLSPAPSDNEIAVAADVKSRKTPSKKKAANVIDGNDDNVTSSARRSGRATRSAVKVKKEESDSAAEEEENDEKLPPSTPARKSTTTPRKSTSRSTPASRKKAKLEDQSSSDEKPKAKKTPASTPKATPSKSTLAKKLKQLETYLQTPFPDFPSPTPEQCQAVQDALVSVHGLPKRPDKLVDLENAPAGCGQVPDVLDALVRTILSQNTTSANSTRAKQAMDKKYGRANYLAVHEAPLEDLALTIACGGLANNKAKSIKSVLSSLVNKQIESGEIADEKEVKNISLDYLHKLEDFDAMKELVSFDGVGPKTASCVLLFCLGRNSFAVDTHVFRITKALGWTPAKANRETAFQHLDVRIPSENKYPLHSLFVRHGRSCRLCSANGNITEAEVDSLKCPIKHILKEQRSVKKGGVKDEDEEEEDGGEERESLLKEEDDEDVKLPKDIADKEEEEGKPPVGDVKPKMAFDGPVSGHS